MNYKVEYRPSSTMTFFIGAVAILFILDVFYGMQLNQWLTLSLGLFMSFFLLNLVYEKKVPDQITASIVDKEMRLFKNQERMLRIRLHNGGWLPVLNGSITLVASDDIEFFKDTSLKIRHQTETSVPFTVMPKSDVTIEVPFRARKRGIVKVMDTRMKVPKIFGFGSLLLTQKGRFLHEILVYPGQLDIPPFDMRNKTLQGLFIQKQALYNDPMLTIGTRRYQQTDSMKDIHWKASAKTGELQTRIYEKTTHVSWLIAINLRSEKTYAPPANIEESIEKIAYLTRMANEASIPYSLFTNLSTFDSRTFLNLEEGAGRLHYRKTLETLARIDTLSYTLSFDRLLKHIHIHEALPSHLLFTGRTDPAIEDMLKSFRAKGVEVFQMDGDAVLPYSFPVRSDDDEPN
ncbi:DUF58 domain-containing protein [Salinicoccus bachuensis]|uniref:DUF58 domain-containing protein n=1 Tax=Salinicoccus bachuensis TaxID=3136731 RepID=A0ABZ3CI60_9STAP